MAGWTAGVGVEYAFLGNWTAKLEYLYVDLGKFDLRRRPAAATVDNVSFTDQHRSRRPELQVLRPDLLALLSGRTQQPSALLRGQTDREPRA